MDALILAAGYATRLGELTRNTPKPLLDVGGRPMIDHILEPLLTTGRVDRVFIVTNDRFHRHFEDWKAATSLPGVELTVVNDGTVDNATRRGGNGDIHYVIESQKLDRDLVVVGGDNLFTFDLAGFLELGARRGAATVLYDVGSFDLARLYSVVSLDDEDRITAFTEKPENPDTSLIATCMYYYSAANLGLFARYLAEGNDKDRTGSFVQWAHRVVPYYGWRAEGEWWDIGDREELERVRARYVG